MTLEDASAGPPPVRISLPALRDDQVPQVEELRKLLSAEDVLKARPDASEQAVWSKDSTLQRYMQARQWNLEKAHTMAVATMTWRAQMKPQQIEPQGLRAQVNGKVYVPGCDAWGRPVIIFDSSKEEFSEGTEGQMRHLTYNMERAVHMLPRGVHRLVVFIKLGDFGLSTAPSTRATLETINIVCNHYPERLGHCVIFQPPMLFTALWNLACTVIDEVTKNKVVFVRGDTSEGSDNDKTLRSIVGPHWKTLIDEETGFNAEVYWERLLEEDAAWRKPAENEEEPDALKLYANEQQEADNLAVK
eukprot:CAMPEP_0115087702 /NCGR_PEP_ID=MMETSP0227-20121206/23485_1 /TAXON_ID=89957 /ORGANISM="Polarella glacialis, Strain CCMP 1383" /LENGTH=302 /DNA_ID=CAMNT_0002477695 /DNA_START=104 /DNA_END=1015 /DNA_ORIENTATION=+